MQEGDGKDDKPPAAAAAADASKTEGDAKPAEPAAAEGEKAAAAAAASEVKAEVKDEKKSEPEVQPSDPATWPQPDAGEVVDGIKWMAKVSRGGEGECPGVVCVGGGSRAARGVKEGRRGQQQHDSRWWLPAKVLCQTCFLAASDRGVMCPD